MSWKYKASQHVSKDKSASCCTDSLHRRNRFQSLGRPKIVSPSIFENKNLSSGSDLYSEPHCNQVLSPNQSYNSPIVDIPQCNPGTFVPSGEMFFIQGIPMTAGQDITIFENGQIIGSINNIPKYYDMSYRC